MPDASKSLFSASRIAQAAWFVVSVYYGLLIGETSKEGLALAIVSPEMSATRLWIIIPTLIFYFFSAAEAYLWLNPRDEEDISGQEAAFRGLLLGIFLIAVIAQSLLMKASNDPRISGGLEFILWLRSFAAVMLMYSLYNVVCLVKGSFFSDIDVPPNKSFELYIGHYFWFAVVFLAVAEIIRYGGGVDLNVAGAACALVFVCYMSSYLAIWWTTWHLAAISAKAPRLYDTRRSNDA